MIILVIAEQRDGKLNRVTWEAVAAARQLAEEGAISVAVLGSGVEAVARELTTARFHEVLTIDQPALERYTSDGYTAALQSAIGQLSPSVVVFPHTYQTRDFAPKLAARLERALITDVTGIKEHKDAHAFTRPMFQGKLAADVVPQGPAPHFVTVQIGAFRADQVTRGNAETSVRALDVTVDAGEIRQKPDPPFQQARQSV